MSRARSTKAKKRNAISLGITASIAVVVFLICLVPCELRVIDESETLEVFTSYGSFSGVTVGPHLILTVAHGANLPGDLTVNHYSVLKIWSDEESDLALLKTNETFYLYSKLTADYPLLRVKEHNLGPGDSGTAIVNKHGAVCFLLKGYDHTAKRYIYVPITKEAIEAIRIALG